MDRRRDAACMCGAKEVVSLIDKQGLLSGVHTGCRSDPVCNMPFAGTGRVLSGGCILVECTQHAPCEQVRPPSDACGVNKHKCDAP